MRSFILLVTCLLLVAGSALGQIEEGARELSIAVSFDQSSTEIEDNDAGETRNLQTLFSYGYFMTERTEIGGALSLSRSSSKGPDDTDWTGQPGLGYASLFLAYHLLGDNPKTVPYLGVDVGKSFWLGWDEDVDGEKPDLYGGTGFFGIKFFLSEKTALGVRGQYRYQKYSVGDFSGTTNTTSLLATISTLF